MILSGSALHHPTIFLALQGDKDYPRTILYHRLRSISKSVPRYLRCQARDRSIVEFVNDRPSSDAKRHT
ncbi:hypothetical protein OUZ56_011092 [Daphnia magna]|uniref:Uncharacterized protein n=1 Tax=Daphnia magna TaxID=35525 RepID=A0ABQ9YZ92_9CRUS|nr:hypothetical protein OUZ56_011092 [Daphnia magna]